MLLLVSCILLVGFASCAGKDDLQLMAELFCHKEKELIYSNERVFDIFGTDNPYRLWQSQDIVQMTQASDLGPYDFLSHVLQEPRSLVPSEINRMMRACLEQKAAYHFIHDVKPPASDRRSERECVRAEFKAFVAGPLDEAMPFLDFMDLEYVRNTVTNPSRCLQQVSSSLAREYVLKVALTSKPSGPSTMDWLRGQRQRSQVFDLKTMMKGIEWVDVWLKLKLWNVEDAKLQGWVVDKQNELVTLYYIDTK